MRTLQHGITFSARHNDINYRCTVFLFQRSQIEHISVKLRASPADGGLVIKDRYYYLRKYHSSFVGELIINEIKLVETDVLSVRLYVLFMAWGPTQTAVTDV